MARLDWARIDAKGRFASSGASGAVFPFWSYTKTVIAAAALRLARGGTVALDAPLPGAPYTLLHLLRHTSGLPDYGALPAYHDAVAAGAAPWPFAKMLARILVAQVTGAVNSPTLRLAASPDGFATIHWPQGRGYDPGWVAHHCLVGTARDAVMLHHGLMTGTGTGDDLPAAMAVATELGGPVPGRPWSRAAYGTGLMCGDMGPAGRAVGHSGVGPFCANAVYHFPDLPGTPTVAAFTDDTAEAGAEWAAVEHARWQAVQARRVFAAA